jgi:hypothetical protein
MFLAKAARLRCLMCYLVVLSSALFVPYKTSLAEEPARPEMTRLSMTDLRMVFDVYERMTKRKLKIGSDVPLNIEVSIQFEGPKNEAIKVIRQALMEKGIELRETETETVVTYAPPKNGVVPNKPSSPGPAPKPVQPIFPPRAVTPKADDALRVQRMGQRTEPLDWKTISN